MKKLILSFLIFIISLPAYAAWQEPVQQEPYLYKFASGVAVLTAKSSSGFLHAITVTGGTTSPIDIYDSTVNSGTIIASFATTNTAQTYLFDVSFSSGCTVVTNNALKYTVSYR